jgi:beta-mannanase
MMASKIKRMLPKSLKRFFAIGVVGFILLLSSCSREVLPSVEPKLFGAYVRGNSSFDAVAINQLEKDLDHNLDIVQWFSNFDDPWEPSLVSQATVNNHIPMITWQPSVIIEGKLLGYSLDQILAGDRDEYMRQWALGAKSFQKSVYVRLMPEMNGDWVDWSGDPEKFKRAWKHIVDLFETQGATNVKWIWAPNCMDGPRDNPNYFMEKYYPGQSYVDVIGLSGFNWGNVEKIHIWRSYDEVFSDAYDRLNKISDHKFWLVETASAEDTSDPYRKADWIKNMFTSTSLPKVEAIIWFNEDKEHDWRVQSSQPTLQAFRDILNVTFEDRSALATLYR